MTLVSVGGSFPAFLFLCKRRRWHVPPGVTVEWLQAPSSAPGSEQRAPHSAAVSPTLPTPFCARSVLRSPGLHGARDLDVTPAPGATGRLQRPLWTRLCVLGRIWCPGLELDVGSAPRLPSRCSPQTVSVFSRTSELLRKSLLSSVQPD